MKTFNLFVIFLVLLFSCLGLVILVHLLNRYQFFYPAEGSWKLVWNDEFDGPELDQSKWTPVSGNVGHYSFRNNIPSIYSDNVTVKDGCLVLSNQEMNWREERDRTEDSYERFNYITYYNTGQVTTKGLWTYGRFEIRAKLPAGQGLLTYASLYPVDEGIFQEIFIIRNFGHDPLRISMGSFLETNQPRRYLEKATSGRRLGLDNAADFHTFAVEWEPENIRWFIDDIKVYQVKGNVPEKIPLALSLGISVGGANGEDPYIQEGSPLLKHLYVDWVRVYQRR